MIILSGGKPIKKLTPLTSLIAGAGMMLAISVAQARYGLRNNRAGGT